MIEHYIRAIETRLRAKTTVKLVEHWNNQIVYSEKAKQLYPAAYVDMGTLVWNNTQTGIKTCQAQITIHCANKNTRDMDDKAPDGDGKRLKRFDWPTDVTAALDHYSARDEADNLIIKNMLLQSCQMDTNHDGLTDDVIIFSALLVYYDTWHEKGQEATIATFTQQRIDEIP